MAARSIWRVDDPDPDRALRDVVGGKGAHLASLTRIDGVQVPEWFCVTTAAYRRTVTGSPAVHELVASLTTGQHRHDRSGDDGPDDRRAGDDRPRRELAARIRRDLEAAPLPAGLEAAVAAEVERLGTDVAYAVRSSATAEDLPRASFAGQHDTSLDVVGLPGILRAIRHCWASLFSDRAVAYRLQHGIDHRRAEMAVLVQRMVRPRASGVLFTADPVTGNRTVAAVEATSGLAEAFVSGSAAADRYRIRAGRIVQRTPAAGPEVATRPDGGTPPRQPNLTDEQVLALVALGRRIEAELGHPQDVEWCLDGDGVQIVQTRPITTLFPVPDTAEEGYRVHVSVGHQQMMTDPMTPLGLSVWQLTSPAPMRVAGGRLFVDVTAALLTPETRASTLETLGRSDPLIRDALETVLGRDDVLPTGADAADDPGPADAQPPVPAELDPAVVDDLVARHRDSVARLRTALRGRSGDAVFACILDDLQDLRELLFDPRSHEVLRAGFEAAWWLDDHLEAWLGERHPADVLSLAAPGNVTAEMGLALLDVADVIRPFPAVVEALRGLRGDDDLGRLAAVEGGDRALAAIDAYLDAYGMRCVGEIDLARPRWSERPAALVPTILSNVVNVAPGERQRRLERGRAQARRAAQELLSRLRALPDGTEKARQAERMIDQLRALVGYREYPKYTMMRHYGLYRQALLGEVSRLVDAGALRTVDDASFLTFQELREVLRTGHVDPDLVTRRRAEFDSFAALSPPRVLTSEGETLDGTYRREDTPAGALLGLAVSSGVVEGRARVVVDVDDADLAPGDVLVTRHTDPSWAPMFVTVAGLVTEVGGLMTHGAVIAREYGLPAVVGVDGATTRIRDGQRVRVDGVRGLVEVLADPGADAGDTSA